MSEKPPPLGGGVVTKASPDDKLTRLVYTDWLEDNADNDKLVARAEWIRAWAEGDETEWLVSNCWRIAPPEWTRLEPEDGGYGFVHGMDTFFSVELSGGFITRVRAQRDSDLVEHNRGALILLDNPLCEFEFPPGRYGRVDSIRIGPPVPAANTDPVSGVVSYPSYVVTNLSGSPAVVLETSRLMDELFGPSGDAQVSGGERIALSRTDYVSLGAVLWDVRSRIPRLMELAWSKDWLRQASNLRRSSPVPGRRQRVPMA